MARSIMRLSWRRSPKSTIPAGSSWRRSRILPKPIRAATVNWDSRRCARRRPRQICPRRRELMSRLLVSPHAPDDAGCVLEVTPRSAGWHYVGFKVCRLERGQKLTGGEADRETCIVALSGAAQVVVDGAELGLVGGRSSVFDDAAPGAVYVPAQCRFVLTAATSLEVALCSAPGRPGRPPRIIPPEAMSREVRGQTTNTRYVRNILPQTE